MKLLGTKSEMLMKGLLSDGTIHAISGGSWNDLTEAVRKIFKRRGWEEKIKLKVDHFNDGRGTIFACTDDEFEEGLALFLEKREGLQDPEEYFKELMKKGSMAE